MKYLTVLLLAVGSLAMGAELDTQKSEFKWEGTKKVGSGHTGQIFLKSYTLNVEDGQVKGGEFVMDMATFTVEGLEGEWEQKFLGHMKSADFFNVEKWPTSKLVITEINAGKARGSLTIKDKTHAIEFTVSETDGAYAGTLSFDRTKFGMIYGSGNFFKNLGDKVINDTVTLTFKAVLK